MNKRNPHACTALNAPFPVHGGRYTSNGTDLAREDATRPPPEEIPPPPDAGWVKDPGVSLQPDPGTPPPAPPAQRGKK